MTGHGGNIHLASCETGIPLNGIMDFSASINPLGVPESAARAITDNISSLGHYPEPFADLLAYRLAAHYGLDMTTVVCGNGSTELIYLIARALQPGKFLVPAPTFSEYERACRLVRGSACVQYALASEKSFDIDPTGFIAAMQGCDMAFLCNPNNPTGRVLSNEAVLAISAAAERMSCYLVVDEAFIDFTPEHSVLRDAAASSHLIVLRSLTKFYALSGLRVGYGVFPRSIIGRIKEHKEPWSVNTLAQKAAIAVLDDKAYHDRTKTVIREEKQFLEQGLRDLGIRFIPSAPNYYLIRMRKAPSVIAVLRKRGILVRNCSNFAGLDDTYIRVAVRSRTENTALLEELASCAA